MKFGASSSSLATQFIVVERPIFTVISVPGIFDIMTTLTIVTSATVIDASFVHAFVASLSVIIVSELGDKTFFIAAILAMRHSRLLVFAGAIAALGLMTVLSALLGYATTVIPHWFTHYVASGLFAVFGLKMLKEARDMRPDEGQSEYEEVQKELSSKEEEFEDASNTGPDDVESNIPISSHISTVRRLTRLMMTNIFAQSFVLTFLAEWGDRSQISTIILAARDDVIGVILGGTLGHALCTGLAVVGGRFVAQRISMRTVHIVGGIVFLIFALSAFVLE